MIEFNINDYVCVRLTEFGVKALASDPLKAAVHFHRKHHDGWTEWQLWDLMNTFGQVMALGDTVPFETTIRLGRLT